MNRSIIYFYAGLILAVVLGLAVLAGCTKAAPAQVPHTQAGPVVAIAVTQCGGLVALYVVLDERHMIRASAKTLALFEIQPDGKVIETARGPLPFDSAMELAKHARIQTRVETACAQPGVST